VATTQPRISGRTVREIAASIERAISVGELSPGDPLPSVRELAAHLDVSPATAASAYRILRDRAFIVTEQRRGTRVSERPALGLRPPTTVPADAVDLASGNPDPALLPSLTEAVRTLELPTHLYGEMAALPEFLETVKADIAVAGPAVEHAVVVAGGLDGIERVLQVHARPGDAVAVEDPCYAGLLDLVRSLGMIPQPIAIDARGPLPKATEAVLASGPTAIVVTPRAQNPTGATIDAERVAELRQVLARFPDLLVIESDHVGRISSAERFTTIEHRDRWALVRSINKSLGPDLRLGVVAGDELTVSRVQGRQSVGCGWVSHVLQRLALQLWLDPEVEQLVSRATVAYRERRERLLAALAERAIPATGTTGFNVWIPVPAEDAVIQALLARNWVVRAGEPYRLESPPGIRVTTSTLAADEALRFADDLARVLRPVHRPRLG
jgi:DNA-binding transcriptional MocR family regulator